MTKKYKLIIAAAICLGLQACATTAPVQPSSLSDEAVTAVTCDAESACDGVLQQKYQYYLGLWSSIFL